MFIQIDSPFLLLQKSLKKENPPPLQQINREVPLCTPFSPGSDYIGTKVYRIEFTLHFISKPRGTK
jgi:hypothetical protein